MKLYKTMSRCIKYRGTSNVECIIVDGVLVWANRTDLKPVKTLQQVCFSSGQSGYNRSIKLSLLENGLYAVVCEYYTILAAYKSADNALNYFNALVEQYRRSENWKEIIF